ncbi:MAG: Pacmanvirus [Bacteroidota bacterium]|jgi:hypothetical protein
MFKELITNHLKEFGTLKGFQQKYKDLIKTEIINYHSFQEFAYFQYYELTERPKCNCGSSVSFRGFANGYLKFCKPCGLKQKWINYEKPNIKEVKKCLNCNNEYEFKPRKKERLFCSTKCSAKYMHENMSKENKEMRVSKIKKTNLLKYGSEWVVNSEYTKNKTFEKHGYYYPFQSEKILNKCTETHKKLTGYTNPLHNPLTVKKMIDTKMDKYGDLLKPIYSYKDFILPSGTTIKVQGYEDLAINYLLKYYKESDIIIGRAQIEKYTGPLTYTSGNKIHRYYPDIYIASKNLVIEVKSKYTFNLHKEKLNFVYDNLKKGPLTFHIFIFNSRNANEPIIIESIDELCVRSLPPAPHFF